MLEVIAGFDARAVLQTGRSDTRVRHSSATTRDCSGNGSLRRAGIVPARLRHERAVHASAVADTETVMTKLRRVVQCASAVAAAGDCWRRAGAGAGHARRIGPQCDRVQLRLLRGPRASTRASTTTCCCEDLSQGEYSLAFDVDDFNGATFGGEWVIGLGEYLEAGVGASFYQRTVPSVYAQKVRDDGIEIAQELKLRIMPITATVRFLPIGRRGVDAVRRRRHRRVQLALQRGRRVHRFQMTSPFNDRFVADGWAAGPVVLGGIRFPVGDVWTVGGEIRWQKAEGKGLHRAEEFFLGDKIDLGGWTTASRSIFGSDADQLPTLQLPRPPRAELQLLGVGELGRSWIVDRSVDPVERDAAAFRDPFESIEEIAESASPPGTARRRPRRVPRSRPT